MRKLTLNQVYVLTLAGLVGFLGALFYLLLDGSRGAVMLVSQTGQARTADELASRVMAFLSQAEQAVAAFERQLGAGTVRADDPDSLERALLAGVLVSEDLAELTFTHVELAPGPEDRSRPPERARIAASPRGQVSVSRERAPAGGAGWVIRSRRTRREGDGFVTVARESPGGRGLLSAPFGEPQKGSDPTSHGTFTGPLAEPVYGRPVWSDLHWAEQDIGRAPGERRVVVTVQRALRDPGGRLLGMMRVGLLTHRLEDITRFAGPGSQRAFICDRHGRLVTRWHADDRYAVVNDDLRPQPRELPEEVRRVLALPALREVSHEHTEASGELVAGDRTYLYTLSALPRSQDWIAGVVVPRDHYLGSLRATQQRVLGGSLGLMGLILVGGMLTLRLVRRDLSRVVDETARMQRFELGPVVAQASLRDVDAVLRNMDQAKVALRALGKYAPIELVKQLYAERIEPVPGGELCEVTLMFTDVEGFTSLSEQLTPNELAQALGRYFEAMARGVHAHEGTIDKYIGDAVMALWNVPRPTPEHPRHACAAALACIRETTALFESEAWRGLPRLRTRFGLHTASVMVGHFGAPDRLNYTALGDGVNLASRLEGINKAYGTELIASEPVVKSAGAHFTFRLLDVVAVKGKKQGVRIYELCGGPEVPEARRRQLRAYEEAFERYLARDFAGALERLAALVETDPPSAVLAGRCRSYLTAPPPADWDGVYVATSK